MDSSGTNGTDKSATPVRSDLSEMTENPVLKEFAEKVDIVPNKPEDKVLLYIIVVLGAINLIAVVIGFIWGV